MFRVFNLGGIALAMLTQLLLGFGCWAGNYLCILFWMREPALEKRPITSLDLTFWGMVLFILFNSLCLLASVAHFRASFGDPGIIPKGIEVPDYVDTAQLNTCAKCEMRWKPQRAHHCSECKACIFKMDHHCPWINNCVGARNYKYFMQFVLFILAASVLLCLLMLLSFYFLLTAPNAKQIMRGKQYTYAFILSIVAFVEGVLFVLFTWELLHEQIESLEDNQTYVDDMQRMWGRPQSFTANCELAFGKDRWFWLLPTHPCLHLNYLERLYPKSHLKQIIRGEARIEEDEWDVNKKHFLIELRRSNCEKRFLLFAVLAGSASAYFFN